MFQRPKIEAVVGLAGVHPDENPRAQLWGKVFEWPMLVVALSILVEWYLDASGKLPRYISNYTDWAIWLFFLLETCLLTLMVDRKFRYLKHNWMNLVIIISGIPIFLASTPYAGILRALRALLMTSLLVHMSKNAQIILSRNHLGTTLFVAAIIILMAGILIAGLDPAITSPFEGIWWAWVTVTTVGYGDIVPTSVPGKVFASLLMLLGLGLFSLLTASISAFFISRQESGMMQQEEQTQQLIHRLEKKLDALEHKVDKLMNEKENTFK